MKQRGFTQHHFFYVYVLQSARQVSQIYIGCTSDLRKRLSEHNSKKVFSTKAYAPWALKYYEAFSDEHLAWLREKRLKYNGNAVAELKKRVGLYATPRKSGAGFTLIEMMVAVALFSVVMLITTSSLLALVDANRKAQELHSVMENLNIAVDGMVRAARMGTTYHCDQTGIITNPADCTANGATFVAFETYGGNPNNAGDQREYWFAKDANNIGRLYESTNGGANSYPVTAPEVNLSSVTFFVSGSTVQDSSQPKMIIIVKGTAGASKVKLQTTFTIQATASERALDL